MEKDYEIENNKKKKYSDSILEPLKPVVGEFFSGLGSLFFGSQKEDVSNKETLRPVQENPNQLQKLKPQVENSKSASNELKDLQDILKIYPRKSGESSEAYQVRIRKIREQFEGSLSKTKKLL